MLEFHIGDLVSITNGALMTLTHMDGIYKILDYMTNDSLTTTQLGHAAEECKPYLYEQFPWLRELDNFSFTEDYRRFIEEGGEDIEAYWNSPEFGLKHISKYGANHMVRPIHFEDHVVQTIEDHIQELKDKYPNLNIIVVEKTEEEPPSPYGDITW